MKLKRSGKKEESFIPVKSSKPVIFSNITVICIFFMLSIVFTYPLIFHFNTHIPACNYYDPPLYVWNSWNFEKTLLAPPHNPFISPNLLYPFEPSVAYHDYTTVRDVLILMFSPLINRIAAFNLVTLLMFTFSAYGAYLLTLRFTKNRFGALLSGFIFSFCPFKMGRLLGQFNFIDSAFIPFYILFLFKTFEDKKPRNALLMGFFLALVGYCSYYYLVFCVIFTFLFLLYYLLPNIKTFVRERILQQKNHVILDSFTRIIALPTLFVIIYLFFIGYIYSPPIRASRMNKPVLLLLCVILLNILIRFRFNGKTFIQGLKSNIESAFGGKSIAIWAASIVVFLFLFAPIIVPIISLSDDYMGQEVVNFRVDNYPSFEEFFRISGLSSIKRFLAGRFEMNLETMISIGWVVLMLIAYSVIFTRKKTHIRFWYLSGGLFALFALGHTLRVQERQLMWMPYNIIQSVPFLKGAINPSRYIIITMLAAGIISAFSVEHIFHWFKQTRNTRKAKRLIFWTAVLLFVFIAAEYSTIPIFMCNLTPNHFYYKLAKDRQEYTILELPFLIVGKARWIGGWVDRWGLFQYYQSIHGKNLISGYLSYIPRDVITYYSKNEFIKDVAFMQDITNPPETKHSVLKHNKKFQTKKFMDLFNIRYIILHKEDLKGGSFEFLKAYLIKCLPEVEKVIDNDELTVYELKPTKIHVFYNRNLLDSRNDMMFIRGWSDYSDKNGAGGRYLTTRKSRLVFPSAMQKDCLLKIYFRLNESSEGKNISLSFFLNKTSVAKDIQMKTNPGRKADAIQITLPGRLISKGSNLVDIEFESGFSADDLIRVEKLEID